MMINYQDRIRGMIKFIKSYFSLKYICYEFTDIVDGSSVNRYSDCFNDIWLKNSRWGLFRVNMNNPIDKTFII